MIDFKYSPLENGTYVVNSYEGDSEHIEFPENITVSILNDDLFKGHTEISSVDIPDSVTNIGGFVFDGCMSLEKLRLPSALEDMWQYAITRCGIRKIEIPGGVRSVVPFTFNACPALSEVRLSLGTRKICSWAFKDCVALSDIYVPEGCEISDKAFEGCKDVTIHRI